ncbi:MAG: MBL fold metallo-hydrolase [Alphaproteobacteria bacterium]|nr:MBL fold metallo-hydrolase [Alphaproteobacteria bacterium]MBQ8729425.1 MBL fold metallo-hydrolase [Alphaproteobacteria bacterium]
MQSPRNKFEIVQMSPQNTNSVVLFDGDKCVVFDPWGRADDWQKYFVSHDVTPTAIYATHGHPDHISAAAELATRFNIDWYMSHMDLDLIEWGNGLLDYFNLPKLSPNDKAPIDIKTGEYTVLSDIKMHVIALPGHTRGGVGYFFPDYGVFLVGDTLFQDSYGRTDLPGGDDGTLFQSIGKIYDMNLPDTTIVIHGHGMHTTIGWLKENNPFFKK